jgi:FMN phosphatase YigB (HAD superfamily)
MHSAPHAAEPGPSRLEVVFFDAEGTLWIPRRGRDLTEFWADPTPANARRVFRVTPGIRTLLARLQRAGLRLVVLSRHNEEILPRLLEIFRLARHFEDVLVNGDKGERAAHWLRTHGVPRRAAIMIGDRDDLDIRPLARVGIRAFLLDRPYNRASPAPRLSDPRDLLPALRAHTAP